MNDEVRGQGKPVSFHSLIPLEDFKALLGVDDRDDVLSRYCLAAATCTIEHYCGRRLLRRKHTDYLTFTGEYLFSLREYPIRKILSVHVDKGRVFGAESLVNPEHYYCLPDEGVFENLPFSLMLRPPFRLPREENAIRVRYMAGYAADKVPADLASACLELAAWNMSRYRGRRIGMTGNIRGSGRDGEHLEISMPEQVRHLLEPYQRRII
jgi:uncharacterized phiE125 gp8 family phage protein